jgi:hypothetical protein
MTDPERSLCLAILAQAVCDFHGVASATQREVQNAQDWINSDVDSPMSFVFVCSMLDFEPQAIRKGLQYIDPERFSLRVNWIARG